MLLLHDKTAPLLLGCCVGVHAILTHINSCERQATAVDGKPLPRSKNAPTQTVSRTVLALLFLTKSTSQKNIKPLVTNALEPSSKLWKSNPAPNTNVKQTQSSPTVRYGKQPGSEDKTSNKRTRARYKGVENKPGSKQTSNKPKRMAARRCFAVKKKRMTLTPLPETVQRRWILAAAWQKIAQSCECL